MSTTPTNAPTKSADETFHCGFVALLGRPNSGKSTLLNRVIDEQLSLVSPVPQTTRKNFRGIYNADNLQIIFIDTPGIHEGKHHLNHCMSEESSRMLAPGACDVLVCLVDVSRESGAEEEKLLAMIHGKQRPVLLVFNKSDRCPDVDKCINNFLQKFPLCKAFPRLGISALADDAPTNFLAALRPLIPAGPPLFPPDQMTDAPCRIFAAEYIRKHILLTTQQEVPHAVFVEIDSYRETSSRHRVSATIHVERNGQRGIIVGPGGNRIQHIRKMAEKDLAELTGAKTSLSLHVKVTPKWRNNKPFLKRAGYETAM